MKDSSIEVLPPEQSTQPVPATQPDSTTIATLLLAILQEQTKRRESDRAARPIPHNWDEQFFRGFAPQPTLSSIARWVIARPVWGMLAALLIEGLAHPAKFLPFLPAQGVVIPDWWFPIGVLAFLGAHGLAAMLSDRPSIKRIIALQAALCLAAFFGMLFFLNQIA